MRMLALGSSLFVGLCLSASSSFAVTASPFEVFTFDGICTDCKTTGHGMGTLTLTNYTPGSAIANSNFIDFTYKGDVSYDVNNSNFFLGNVSGNISSAPGFYNFNLTTLGIEGFVTFSTDTAGSWNTGVNVLSDDQGNTGTWNGSAVVSGVPESSTWAMMLLGFGGLGFLAYRKAAKCPRTTEMLAA